MECDYTTHYVCTMYIVYIYYTWTYLNTQHINESWFPVLFQYYLLQSITVCSLTWFCMLRFTPASISTFTLSAAEPIMYIRGVLPSCVVEVTWGNKMDISKYNTTFFKHQMYQPCNTCIYQYVHIRMYINIHLGMYYMYMCMSMCTCM